MATFFLLRPHRGSSCHRELHFNIKRRLEMAATILPAEGYLNGPGVDQLGTLGGGPHSAAAAAARRIDLSDTFV